MLRALVLLTTIAMVLAGAGTALADPPFDHPGQGGGPDNRPDHAGPGERIEICHVTEEGDHVLLELPEKAVEAHLAHGDVLADDAGDDIDCTDARSRVEICHVTEEGDYFVIEVSERALEAHLAHGDFFVGEVDEENRRGKKGRADCESLGLLQESAELSPETVLANGGIYDNDDVHDAIAAGFTGEVDGTFDLETGDVTFDFQFSNLVVGDTYTVYLDGDGGSPGPFTVLGTFTADAFGEGTFQYTTTLASGDYTWSFWVNQPSPPASVLQTEDFTFTIP